MFVSEPYFSPPAPFTTGIRQAIITRRWSQRQSPRHFARPGQRKSRRPIGAREETRYGPSSSCRHLPVLHQPGSAGRPAGLRLAHHIRGAGGPGVLHGDHLHDHLRRHRRLQPLQRPADPAAGRRRGHRPQRGRHRRRPPRLLRQPLLPGPVPVGGALRPGGGQRGRGAEQLCGPPLHQPPHELAPLHVGHWGFPGPLRHDLCPGRRPGVEHGLPVHQLPADRSDSDPGAESGSVEGPVRGGGKWRGTGPPPAPGHHGSRNPGDDAAVLLLLRPGDHCGTVGQQLPGPGPGPR